MILNSVYLRNLPESDEYPFNLELIKHFEEIVFNKNVCFLVGENGSGKSTLLEGIAAATNLPTAGSMPILDDPLMEGARDLAKMLVLRSPSKSFGGFFARAEDFIGFVKNIQNSIAALDQEIAEIKTTWTGGDIKLALGPMIAERKAFTDRYSENLDAMSHGEGFLKFFKARITGKGLYLIDEPEAALSPARQLALMALILDKIKENDSQFIIATHSPLIMALPNSQIMFFENGQITEINYTETPHYQLTKQFLEDPEAYLKHLQNSE